MVTVAPPNQYSDCILDVFEAEFPPDGRVAAFHCEDVHPNTERSAVILESGERNWPLNHGLVHIRPGVFRGDARKDAELIDDLLRGGRHVALTVQAHPEETGAERLITFAETGELKGLEEPPEDNIADEYLKLFASFLWKHKAFSA